MKPTNQARNYTKKSLKTVTDPDTLYTLKYMVDNVHSYSRNPFKGLDINGVRSAFYFGKVSNGGNIGMATNIVLSSNKKVYNISDVENPIEMNWNQDRSSKGKRGFGHIYLGALTGGRAFETNIQSVFQMELGVII